MTDPNTTRVLVVGIPRSGTSAVACVLHHMGCCMGTKLNPPDKVFNPSGFYEDMEFVSLHSQVENIGLNVKHWLNLEKEIIEPEYFETAYCCFIAVRNERHDVWGLKDMRVLHFLDTYLKYAMPLKVIWVVRSANAVMKSMDKCLGSMNGNIVDVYSSWQRLIWNSLKTLDKWNNFGASTYLVQYEKLIYDTERTVIGIADFVGLTITENVSTYVRPELNRCG